ncbi:MAG: hypothetical protein WCK26_01015 [Candidatus Saccharibacteria bacterium]
MALFISQNDERSELQKRIASELQRKSKESSQKTERPDGVDDSQYIKGMKTTSSMVGVWAAVIIAGLVLIIWLTVISMSR